MQIRRMFPGWTIARDDRYDVWTAEKRTGTALRYVVAHRPVELAVKLTRIEAATPV
jgi:hypothetical protein